MPKEDVILESEMCEGSGDQEPTIRSREVDTLYGLIHEPHPVMAFSDAVVLVRLRLVRSASHAINTIFHHLTVIIEVRTYSYGESIIIQR